jgi:hypothetical protein
MYLNTSRYHINAHLKCKIMKTTAASLLMFFLVLTTVVSGQTPYQAYFDYSGAYTNSITDVNAVLRNTNLDWVVVGSANEPYNNAADMYPVIYAIQHNNPGTVIITPTTIQVSLDPTKPVKFVCKDIVEFQGSNFAICGSVEYDGASGGTAGFLLIVDGNHTPLALYIYDNLLTINSLIFNGQYDKIILVGQSFQDSYGATWNSLPCVMVVDGGSPDNIISSYVCEDGSPSHNEGEYNDIDYVTNNGSTEKVGGEGQDCLPFQNGSNRSITVIFSQGDPGPF